MSVFWSDAALERSRLSVDDLILLTGDKYDLAELREWERHNLASDIAARPSILYTSSEITRYARLHAEMFGRRAAS